MTGRQRRARIVALARHGRDVETVFDLLGDDENDMTAALGVVLWAPHAFDLLLADLSVSTARGASRHVRLQRHYTGGGITDVELVVCDGSSRDDALVVLEAKRGYEMPTRRQLAQYAAVARDAPARTRLLVTISRLAEAPAAVQAARLGYAAALDGVPVTHRSLRRVQQIVRSARARETHAGRRVIDAFSAYLNRILGMETQHSAWTYVVSLGSGHVPGGNLSERDVTTKRARYDYPVGKAGWPEPPNYIAFRYDGGLQSIHHVEQHEVFTHFEAVLEGARGPAAGPHYLLHLGPPILPPKVTPNGPRSHRSNRAWCHLDTLLTAATIREALDITQARSAP